MTPKQERRNYAVVGALKRLAIGLLRTADDAIGKTDWQSLTADHIIGRENIYGENAQDEVYEACAGLGITTTLHFTLFGGASATVQPHRLENHDGALVIHDDGEGYKEYWFVRRRGFPANSTFVTIQVDEDIKPYAD